MIKAGCGGMWDSDGKRDENVLVGPGCVLFCRRDVGCSEIEGGMRVQTRQKHDPGLALLIYM